MLFNFSLNFSFDFIIIRFSFLFTIHHFQHHPQICHSYCVPCYDIISIYASTSKTSQQQQRYKYGIENTSTRINQNQKKHKAHHSNLNRTYITNGNKLAAKLESRESTTTTAYMIELHCQLIIIFYLLTFSIVLYIKSN